MLDRPIHKLMPSTHTKCHDTLPLRVSELGLERNNETLLAGVTFSIISPGITLVMGPNGAGKSVLIRLLHGLDEASTGQIEWGSSPFDQTLRKRQAMVFQKPVLLRRSTAANIDFALRLADSKARANREQLLEAVGLNGMASRPARLLSGGEQQRLALARALASTPDILFLDEPTANLDPSSTKIIEDIVMAEREAGTKVIFVTHDIGQAQRLGDEVLFLNRGRLAEHTAAESFFSHPKSAAARDYLAGRIVL